MLAPDSQVRAYAALRALEARSDALDELLASLKRRCLQRGPEALADIIAAAAEVRWHVRLLGERVGEFERTLGLDGSRSQPPQEAQLPLREPNGIRGSTEAIAVSDLVAMLSSLRKTGTLTLQGREVMFVFEFQDGAVVHAVTNRMQPDMRLGTILVAQNLITEEQLEQNLVVSAVGREMLGAQLVRSETVSATDLRAALEVQVRRIFDAAFDLENARFEFEEGNLSSIAQRVSLNTTHLLLEAARQADERRRAEAELETAAAAAATRSALDSILPG